MAYSLPPLPAREPYDPIGSFLRGFLAMQEYGQRERQAEREQALRAREYGLRERTASQEYGFREQEMRQREAEASQRARINELALTRGLREEAELAAFPASLAEVYRASGGAPAGIETGPEFGLATLREAVAPARTFMELTSRVSPESLARVIRTQPAVLAPLGLQTEEQAGQRQAKQRLVNLLSQASPADEEGARTHMSQVVAAAVESGYGGADLIRAVLRHPDESAEFFRTMGQTTSSAMASGTPWEQATRQGFMAALQAHPRSASRDILDWASKLFGKPVSEMKPVISPPGAEGRDPTGRLLWRTPERTSPEPRPVLSPPGTEARDPVTGEVLWRTPERAERPAGTPPRQDDLDRVAAAEGWRPDVTLWAREQLKAVQAELKSPAAMLMAEGDPKAQAERANRILGVLEQARQMNRASGAAPPPSGSSTLPPAMPPPARITADAIRQEAIRLKRLGHTSQSATKAMREAKWQ